MSYTPRLVIDYLDLKYIEEKIEYSEEPEDQFLMKTLKRDIMEFILPNDFTIRLVSCHPEFSAFNKTVRERLDELGVQYQCDN